METHPLLVYMSALPFTPTKTILYQTFHRPDLYPSIAGGFQHTWSPLQMVLMGHEDSISSVAISCNGKRIVSGSDDSTIRVWDTATGAEVREIQQTSPVQSVELSPDGRQIAAGYFQDCTIQIWDALSGTRISVMQGHQSSVQSVKFSPDGRRIISGSHDNSIRVWDTTTGAEAVPTIRGHLGKVNSVVFSPNGKKILSLMRQNCTSLGGRNRCHSLSHSWELWASWRAIGRILSRRKHDSV
jgi:WD40 repeat protein